MDDPVAFDVDRWCEELQSKRREKDRFFVDHPQSPVPPDARDEFEGLSYFPPASEYRVRSTVALTTDPEADPVTMETTAGREYRYLRLATLSFPLERDEPDLEDGTYALDAYHQPAPGGAGGNATELFVPFRDKTTGQQTYAGGRYMELSVEEGLDDEAELVLDFNLAYTPFCAFSETFDCPLPPEENWLPVTIPAGERFEA